jgi:hypothetical protein
MANVIRSEEGRSIGAARARRHLQAMEAQQTKKPFATGDCEGFGYWLGD